LITNYCALKNLDLKKIKESIVIYEHSNYEELMKEEQITEVNHKKRILDLKELK